MEEIKNQEFGGERPLFGRENLRLENVTVHAGESALKFGRNIEAVNSRFEGKYPFWHCENFLIEDCTFTEGGRAALWYGHGCTMRHCKVDAPKMFRDLNGITVEDTEFPDAEETLWHCRDIKLRDVKVFKADYLFMHSSNIDIKRYEQHGNYSFQYCRNVSIENADIHSKDAFWNTENVTVRNSKLSGEYLGWYSKGLHLIDCHIEGTQPLCYCRGLVLENCTFDPDCDLAFEDSEIQATIASRVTSIKNPRTGRITVPEVGQLIFDDHLRAPGNCKVDITRKR